VRQALETLPGVEKDSVKVNKEQKLAMFKVKEPDAFKVEDAVKKIEGIGSRYKAAVNKTGKAVAAGKAKSDPAGDAAKGTVKN
jgi:ABC-type molybdate transport system substrate-binding protein